MTSILDDNANVVILSELQGDLYVADRAEIHRV